MAEKDLNDFVVAVTVFGKSSEVGILFDRNLVLITATEREKYDGISVYGIYGK